MFDFDLSLSLSLSISISLSLDLSLLLKRGPIEPVAAGQCSRVKPHSGHGPQH